MHYIVDGFVTENPYPVLIEGSRLPVEVPASLSDGVIRDRPLFVYVPVIPVNGTPGVTIRGNPDIIGPLSLGAPWVVGSGRRYYVRLIGHLSMEPMGDSTEGNLEYIMRPVIIEVLSASKKGLLDTAGDDIVRKSEHAARRAFAGLFTEKEELGRMFDHVSSSVARNSDMHVLRCLFFASLQGGHENLSERILQTLSSHPDRLQEAQMTRSLVKYFSTVMGSDPRDDSSPAWRVYVNERIRME